MVALTHKEQQELAAQELQENTRAKNSRTAASRPETKSRTRTAPEKRTAPEDRKRKTPARKTREVAVAGEPQHSATATETVEQPPESVNGNGAATETALRGRGTLEVLSTGYGFLRHPDAGFHSSPDDIYVAASQIRRFNLRTGVTVEGIIRPPTDSQQYSALVQVESVDGQDPELVRNRRAFDELTARHPRERFVLEHDPQELTTRVLDLLAPVGKGQRGLIVSPPRAGKTMLLQAIARAVQQNHPECYLIVLLIDERPEEVTEMQQMIQGPSVEVLNSTFDRPAAEHIRVSEMVLEQAKSLVESGRDVVILLDSITRLARAYNTEAPSGRLLTGGLTVGALDGPKRFFGSARQTDEGGSLTILATALIDTGSKMDEVIFEEFKGTGNMEVFLDRLLADRRIWPALNIRSSGTRREELLLDPEELRLVTLLRRTLSGLNPVEAMSLLVERLRKTRTNAEFLLSMQLK